MLNYDPKDAEQVVWPNGDYDAELIKVESKPHKTPGHEMEVWTVRVWSPDGQEKILSDYVVSPTAVWKIKQFAIALGKKDAFDGGIFQAEDHLRSSFIVELALEVDKNGTYPDKNKIKKYKPSPAAPAPSQSRRPQSAAVGAPFGDEATVPEADIPFAWEPLTRWV